MQSYLFHKYMQRFTLYYIELGQITAFQKMCVCAFQRR